MNLTFIFDGYLAETALESSFQLFVFDGYLIYGEVPPSDVTVSEVTGAGAQRRGRIIYEDDEHRTRIERDNQDWLDIISIFMRINQN